MLILAMHCSLGAMNESNNVSLLHQPLNGFLDPSLRCWLLNMIKKNSTERLPLCILDTHESPVCKVVISPDGKTVATVTQDHKIHIWDTATATCRHTLVGHTGSIEDIKLLSTRNYIISASQDCTVRLWDLGTGTCKTCMEEHTGPVLELNVTPDESAIVTRSTDNTACVWNLLTGKWTWIYCYPNILHQVFLTPDGSTVITRSGKGIVQAWNVVDGTCSYTLPGHPYYIAFPAPPSFGNPFKGDNIGINGLVADVHSYTNGPINYLFISLDGKTLVTSDTYAGGAFAWDTASGARRCVLNREYSSYPISASVYDHVNFVAFSPDGTMVIIAFVKGSLRLVNLTTGEQKDLFTGGFPIRSISWCPNSNSVVRMFNL